jgi:molecular chaperone DnaK
VAQGAAIHAAILEARFRGESSELAERIRKLLRNVKQEDVNSHGLGVAARNPKTGKTINHVMIPRNSKLPAEVHRTFVTSEPNQQRVNIKVIEGDAPDPDACSLLGNCRITGLPKDLPKGSPIEVVYAFDSSGRVRVRATDKTGGKEAEIEIERKGGLNASQLTAYTSLADRYRVE